VEVVDDEGRGGLGTTGGEGVGPHPDRPQALLGGLLLGAVGRLGPAAPGVEDLLQGGQGQRLAGQLEAGPLEDVGDGAGAGDGDERGLADAGLTADEHDVARLGERRGDCRAVVRPADIGDRPRPDHLDMVPPRGDGSQAYGVASLLARPTGMEPMSSFG
jgi:hypothetical protein